MAITDWFRKKPEEAPVEEEQHYAQQPFPQTFIPQQPLPIQQGVDAKDLEVISAKLDAIKALLESLNQRLANLERIARE